MRSRGRREIENRWIGYAMEDLGDQKEVEERRDGAEL